MEFFQENIIPGEVFVQLIAFLIVFFTLKAYAWKPVQNALAMRRERIRNEFDRIEAAKKEIETLKAEYQGRLSKIEDLARTQVQKAVSDGRRIAEDIQDKAKKDAESLFAKMKENLELEVAKSRIELRREIAGLAVDMSERVLKEKMGDAKKQEEKIAAMIEEIEKGL